jgi:hypothetical protein
VASPSIRAGVSHFSGATDEEKAAVELVAGHALAFEDGIGTDFRERCNRFYRQYRRFTRFKSELLSTLSENDRDEVITDAKKDWGAQLHIPLSFRTIETKVPRAIAHRPRMLVLPRHQKWEENVAPLRMLIDAQQDQINIDLPFQAVMRSGMIYGLGVGKTFWRKEYANQRKVQRRTLGRLRGKGSEYTVGKLRSECTFDDPDFEDVDVFDFMWDPYGSDVRSCSWMLHRTWLGLDGALARVADGSWNTKSAGQLDEEELRRLGGGQRYDEVWQERMTASGFGTFAGAPRGEQVHEVWEWHDGERVLTVLDRSVLVQAAENPTCGVKPFHVYRPTPLQRQMVGIGELEPIEHLQRELDTLRSQRRDAASLALNAPMAYDDAVFEPEDLKNFWRPNNAIRASNSSNLAAALMKLEVRDVPGSAFQDEQVIRGDMDMVSGISDADGAAGTISTATEAQLVQAALSKRIELQSRRFEIEVVRGAARCFVALDQRMILEDRQVRQADHGSDEWEAMQEGRWKWFQIGPGELQGEFEIVPEGGSMAARNIPQDRQDAVQVMQLFGQNPFIDPRRPLLKALELFGIKDTEAWLKQTEKPVPPVTLQYLESAGVRPELIQFAVQQAQAQDPQLAQDEQGPDSAAVANMMGGSG